MIKRLSSFIFFSVILVSSYPQEQAWGNLANDGFENQPLRSTFFFAGNWRNGVQFYDFNPSNNTGLYTVHPDDARHLGWSESVANRDFAVTSMIDAGINVINLSYWGLPGTDNWAHWAPMQSSTASHDELFNAAVGKNILIAPYIESFAATNDNDGFIFADDFPGSGSDPAPVLMSFLEDLINRYLIHPDNGQWPQQWARVFDQDGQERYLVSIIHVASNQDEVNDQSFAEAFDLLASAIFETTGIRIGFALDILPPDNYAPGTFKATPMATGPWLKQQSSVLAIQCFIPEIWTGKSDENDLNSWKENYLSSWIKTGIPVIHDISPGYDAHIVFPTSPSYGNNQIWRDLQSQQIDKFGSKSLTFNAWNGYPEGFAGMPTLQYGDSAFQWLCGLMGGNCGNTSSEFFRTSPVDLLRILPNPFTRSFTFGLRTSGEEIVIFRIYNCEGQLVLIEKVDQNADLPPEITVRLDGLPDGMYSLVVHTHHGTYTKKILKVN